MCNGPIDWKLLKLPKNTNFPISFTNTENLPKNYININIVIPKEIYNLINNELKELKHDFSNTEAFLQMAVLTILLKEMQKRAEETNESPDKQIKKLQATVRKFINRYDSK